MEIRDLEMKVSIPVTWIHEGKEYKGNLDFMNGSGTCVWYLFINNFFQGQLLYFPRDDGWRYADQTKYEEMLYLSAYFGDVVTAWFQ